MPFNIRPFTRVLIAVVLLCLAAPRVAEVELLAQVRTVGAITGTVTDPEGNPVPGATVALRDERTNIARETVSNEQGSFRFLDLQAGSYEVTVTLTGFQATVFKNVAVESARTTDLAVHMNVGQVTEAIEVIGAAPTLAVTTNTLSTTVTHADVQNLPLAGRNVLNFALLVPGAQTAGTDPRQSTYQGMPGATLNITVDGINNNSGAFRSGGTSFFATVPPRLDAVEEVNISTGGLGADAGAEGAMAIRFVTRRGTNSYHGGGFFQYVHEDLNSNNYFNNARGLPKPRARRNEFGGNLGGPILRNKAFFFVNWEEARIPNVVIVNQSVLTEEATRGVFRYRGTDGVERTADLLAIARAGGFPGTADPIVAGQLSAIASTYGSAALSTTDLYRRNLSFNEPQKAIEHFPTTRIDYQITPKLSVNGALNVYDRDIAGARRFPGDLTAYSVFQNTWLIGSTSANYTLTPTTLIEFRYGLQRNQDTYNIGEDVEQFDIGGRRMRLSYPFQLASLVPNQLQIDRNNALHQFYNNVTLVRGNHTITTGGSYRWIRWFDADFQGGGVPQFNFGVAAGDPAANLFNASTLPGISANDITTAAQLYAFVAGRLSGITATRGVNPDSLQYEDAKQLVRHDKQRVGGLWIQDSWRVNPSLTLNYGLRWQVSGAIYNDTDVYTSPTVANLYGPSTALFAPGQLNGVRDPVIDLRPRTYGTDWNNFAPNVRVSWNPSFKGGLLSRLTGGDKTVFRGGYSVSYFDEGLNTFINYSGANPGLTQRLSLSPGQAGFAPGGLTLSSAIPALTTFPVSFSPPFRQADYTFGTNGTNAANPTTVFATTEDTLRTPYVRSWNFGVQREIAANTVIEARYVGNHSTRWHGYDINEINIFENGFLQEFKNAQQNLTINRAAGVESFANRGLPGQVALPIFDAAFGARGGQAALPAASAYANTALITQLGQGQAGGAAATLASSSTYLCRMVGSDLEPCARLGYNAPGAYPINVFQANPFAAGTNAALNLMSDDGSFANYHGLQLEFRRRYSKGFTINANYTFAKALGDMYADSTNATRHYTTLRDKSIDRGPSPFDIRHAFQANWTYELPFGADQRFATGSGILDRVIGGWSFSGIMRWQSGRPFRLTSGRNTFNQRDSGVVLNGITRDDLQKMIEFRATDNGLMYFVAPELIGSDGRANPQYIQSPTTPGELGSFIYLQSPQTMLTDLAVHKNVPLKGNAKLSIWVEALNAFNHANFLIGPGVAAGPEININATNFGQTTVVGNPRNVQIRAKLSF
jgi:hypothetical protein